MPSLWHTKAKVCLASQVESLLYQKCCILLVTGTRCLTDIWDICIYTMYTYVYILDICRAAGWATPNTFTRFYSLRVEQVSSCVLTSKWSETPWGLVPACCPILLLMDQICELILLQRVPYGQTLLGSSITLGSRTWWSVQRRPSLVVFLKTSARLGAHT